MDEKQITKDLVDYLRRSISADLLPSELSLDFPLLESGALDSLELFKLIAHIEDSFDIQIKPEEVVPDNFATIQTIVQVVLGHLS